MKIAICIFGYNRPSEIRKTLHSLSECYGLNTYDIHVFIDGPKPKKESDIKNVNQVLNIIETSGLIFCSKTYSSTNKGLKKSIKEGITQISQAYDAFLVLEDDIVLSPHALKYTSEMLEKFDGDDRVMHINLWNHPSISMQSPYFSKYMHCWGWATWSSHWSNADFSSTLFQDLSITQRYNITKHLSTLHLSHLYANFIGIRETWAIFWLTHISLKNGKCISPPFSLVENIGLNNGEHEERYRYEQVLSKTKVFNTSKTIQTSWLNELKLWFYYFKGAGLLSIINTIQIMLLK